MDPTITKGYQALKERKDYIIVFLLPIDAFWLENEFNFEVSLRLLPLRNQLKVKNQKYFRDRCLGLGNQLLLVYVLWLMNQSWSIEQVLSRLHHGSNGKPMFEDVDFNLSNDKESLLNSMAIAGGTVGLDTINFHLINRQFVDEIKLGTLHDSELALLEKQTEEEDYLRLFAQLWSLKESYTKYLGTGLIGVDLKQLEFRNVRLITTAGDSNTGIQLYIDGKRKVLGAIMTRLYNDQVYYSVVTDKDSPSLQEIVVGLKDLCSVLNNI
ncbi:holo-[acyl-carrier-protein] synthase [Saccharomycopsis crataegensis]|uniref:holo-[acyl-carrier-protein] synthase n=1 Tax=Saccharomycopsis crataegensis TaxID=43959 RepID=A0AAV5QX42_9ASCO|nr:holo-[acyl-carrier-protein] synthase [Saccharomycopsis crataegensis]